MLRRGSSWMWGFTLLSLILFTGGCSKEGGDGGSAEFGPEQGIGDPGDGSKFGLTSNAALEFTPSVINFGSGANATIQVTVTNVGTGGSIELLSAYMKGGSPQFGVTLPESRVLGPLQFEALDVTYTPGEGSDEDVLVIEHTSAFQGPLQIPIKVIEGAGFLSVSPSSLEFGDVVFGDSATKAIQIENLGNVATPLDSIVLGQNTPEDFSFSSDNLPSELGIGEILTVDVTYTPDGVGTDVGELLVTGGDEGKEFIVSLSGVVSGPKLVAIPGLIDFGNVPVGTSKEIIVTLKNIGTAPLVLDSVGLDTWTSQTVVLAEMPGFPLTIEEDAQTEVTLVFTPDANMPTSLDSIGALVALGTGTGGGPLLVPIYGNPAAPEIFVSPDFLDFGLVASGDTVQRDLVIMNKGKEGLTVESVLVALGTSEEFEVLGFAPANWETPGYLQPDESVTALIGFTNNGAEGGVESGSLEIVSNDADEALVTIGMEAKRGGLKSCDIEVSPPTLNFAIVPHGFTKTMPVTIKNVGSGPCTYLATSTYECDGLGGLFGTGGCSQGLGGGSQYFKVVAQPPPVPQGIGQGESVAVQIMFVPPDNAPLLSFFDTYQGAFQVTVTDPNNGGAAVQSPVGATPVDLSANLVAQSGISDISVIPSTIDFGLVTIGCSSPEEKITIYNNGNAPLTVSDITLDNCTPEFTISQLPPIPPEGLEVTQQNPVELYVQYKPQVSETSFCTLSIQSTDQDQALLTVPMQGTGTFETEQTDVFTQLSGQMVDILFVVDDSGSMGEEQTNLSQNFSALMQEANTWGTDYQMGVVTTDIKANDSSGKLKGSPKIVTPGPSAESQFQSNVQVGDNGAGDQEAGLEAANMALSMPLIYEGTNTTCATTEDCASYGDGLTCTGGKCAGWNAGFLREDAALEIVFVSDEEDQSPGPLNFYIDFLKSIKGFANEGLMHAHAIVGDSGSGCSSGNGDASSGDRYIEVANQTGGQVGSICDSNFASVLSSIGEVAFGLKVQFFLSANAEPSTVAVSINGQPCGTCDDGTSCTVGDVCMNGQPCESGWEFDDASNSVIFDSEGACMPDEGDEISIYYKMLCLP